MTFCLSFQRAMTLNVQKKVYANSDMEYDVESYKSIKRDASDCCFEALEMFSSAKKRTYSQNEVSKGK